MNAPDPGGVAVAALAPYLNPTAALQARRGRIQENLRGADPVMVAAAQQTAAKAEKANARAYAISRLKQLAQAGLGDANSGLSRLAQVGLTATDPAAVWRALSAKMMAEHAQAAPAGQEADPRIWLAAQVARKRQTDAQARAAQLAQGRANVLGV